LSFGCHFPINATVTSVRRREEPSEPWTMVLLSTVPHDVKAKDYLGK